MSNKPNTGQAIVEYAILIGIVTASFLAMQLYARRGLQAGVKMVADQMGDQAEGIRYESGERTNKVVAEGRTLARHSKTAASVIREANTIDREGGIRETRIEEETIFSGLASQEIPGNIEPGIASYAEVLSDVR